MNKNYQAYSMRSPLASVDFIVNVLLIEDDYSYAELVKILLADTGELTCNVSYGATLAEGFKHLEGAKEFDAILLDLTLPDSTGIDTLHQLLYAYPDANVIVLTGNSDQRQGIEAVGAGAQDFLVKGDFDPKQLARSLRFSMERKHIITRLEETQRLAKIGHWTMCTAKQQFDAGSEVYRFFGFDPSIKSCSFEEILTQKCKLNILCTHEFHHPDKETFSHSFQWKNKDGSLSYGQVNSKRSYTSDGTPIYIGSLQDITLQRKTEELERAKELAEETARVREQVIANVSHELRTPMNAILGLGNVMNKNNFDKDQHECFDNIQEASQVLLSIINDILLTSSLQNGKVEIDNTPFDVALTIRRITEVLMPKANAKGLPLNYDVDSNLLHYLAGDKQKLTQILYNFIGNAIKFTDEGAIDIKVILGSIKKKKQWLIFEIHDTGGGIAEEELDEIFQPFSRIKTPGKKIEGTGLGLTISQQLIKQMGGEVQVSSVLGKGSVFSFTLPFGIADKLKHQKTPIKEKDNESLSSKQPQSLMVVEDHLMNQLVIRKTLEKKWPKLQLYMAKTGEEALEMLSKYEVDIILMDIQLPGIDGYETTRKIRSELSTLHGSTPVLAMTAQPLIANDNHYLTIGMNDYILKPFDPKKLFHKIVEHLN